MRTPADYAREFLANTSFLKSKQTLLAETIEKAQAEAYREGMQVGMTQFLNMAVESRKSLNGAMPQSDLFGTDPHDNVLNGVA